MKRIGIFGGTFDPIHNGHLIMAENVKDQMHLDEVMFIPSRIPPLKDAENISAPEHRLNMLRLAAKGSSSFKINDIELKMTGDEPNYTVKTLLKLREEFSAEQVKFYLIIGMDQLIKLHKWKDPGKLFLLTEVVVINRPGYLIQQVENEYARRGIFVPVPNIDISATDIRFRIREKRSIKYLVPEEVEEYIYKNNLYK
ncbi:MAG TPA: nicotinate-nucleotide adenylyltransferase [Ignavibacteria bacterium]|nr:nicotinate-nucleotide adenylyltransferase [Ignavibacteria bacterium]HRF64833.1 nicotinate-nucleotide adenylyltransferase [Ignavibacteria bacterium]HRJ04595.1 nicotinate-nucleotide adenylyltransferase [Ignavibacteria bacterium]HRJ85880.1 nicotinate-nucleotide adenylyltransferase [Ignavibacteria bacterium]